MRITYKQLLKEFEKEATYYYLAEKKGDKQDIRLYDENMHLLTILHLKKEHISKITESLRELNDVTLYKKYIEVNNLKKDFKKFLEEEREN